MNEIEFSEKEFQFIEDIKNSDLYQRMISLNKEINADEELSKLAEERDHYLALADQETDETKKHELLVQFNQTDNLLRANPKMVEYLQCYQSLHKILAKLGDGLTKEIKQ